GFAGLDKDAAQHAAPLPLAEFREAEREIDAGITPHLAGHEARQQADGAAQQVVERQRQQTEQADEQVGETGFQGNTPRRYAGWNARQASADRSDRQG